MTPTPVALDKAIARGTRRLRMMPAEKIAALDPYMAEFLSYRKSGLSLNHVIGCPLDCAYCVRHFWGNFDQKIPQLIETTANAVQALVDHVGFEPHVTPIQIFNKATDPFLPAVKPELFAALRDLDERGLTNMVLLITRFRVTSADMAQLEALTNLRVTLLFTYSGIGDRRIEPIAKSSITVTSLRIAAHTPDRRTKVILYWRPIVPGWNDQPDTMAHVLDVGRDVDAIVFTGYYHKPENAEFITSLGIPLPYGIDDVARRKAMPADIDDKVVAAWKNSGMRTPLYRKTSCGVSAVHGVADYNGHWGVNDLCDICPVAQRNICRDAHQPPTTGELDALFDKLGYTSAIAFDDGHIWTHRLTDQQRFPIQHQTGYQVWDTTTPHFQGNHGRSLVGFTPAETDQQHIAEVRRELEHQTRFDDD
ncbi:hypothetical protein FPZ12_024000 [Amycolatopsis acidicola]|uniref:Radical SAM protein n=1 Tax=Amycolatopsis acidicola TaxID=2596893 RepID=A0A5N0V148_9PSEU|nr:hypothetical protein [Amycolatopsis acidicola]KAA9157949.1 hypothetical protein FPZ12_024000 [Amycolatopsis acidicola]